MTDVVPEMLKDIDARFKANVMSDRRLASVSKRIRDGTATQIDAHAYAEQIGKASSKALQDVLTVDRLPDGRLYYNIAQRTVTPTLQNNQRLVNEAASTIQKGIDAKQKIRMNSVEPEFPASRVQGLIDKMTADDILVEDALKWLGEPIVNNTESFMDDFIKENADFRAKSGLKPTISRIAEAKCCDWCASLEGTWEYGYAPDDVYRRHEFCRCAVTVTYKRETQDVWSKRSWESSPEEIERREGIKPQHSTVAERKAALERVENDALVKKIMDVTGWDRRDAQDLSRQAPDKVQKTLARYRARK